MAKILSFLLALVSLILTTGCWDYVEIHNMLIVAGIGLDWDEEAMRYHSTVEFVDIESNGGENIESKIVESDGDTIYSALQNAMTMTGGSMFSNHCKVIVIGDSLARQGINEVVDFVLRSSDFRKTVEVFVARDNTAQKILTQKTVKSDVVSFELEKILRSNYKNINNTISKGMYELHEALISECPSAVLPVVSIRKNNDEDVLLVEGGGLFSGDCLQGFLSAEQCRVYNILTRSLNRGYLLAENAAFSEKPIGAKLMKSNVKYAPNISGDELSMLINISADIVLDGSEDLSVDLSDEASVERLQECFGDELSKDAEAFVKTVQSFYNVDAFDFYKEFKNDYRTEWPTLREDWPRYFEELQVSVVSDVRITGSGLIGNYAPKRDGSAHGNALP